MNVEKIIKELKIEKNYFTEQFIKEYQDFFMFCIERNLKRRFKFNLLDCKLLSINIIHSLDELIIDKNIKLPIIKTNAKIILKNCELSIIKLEARNIELDNVNIINIKYYMKSQFSFVLKNNSRINKYAKIKFKNFSLINQIGTDISSISNINGNLYINDCSKIIIPEDLYVNECVYIENTNFSKIGNIISNYINIKNSNFNDLNKISFNEEQKFFYLIMENIAVKTIPIELIKKIKDIYKNKYINFTFRDVFIDNINKLNYKNNSNLTVYINRIKLNENIVPIINKDHKIFFKSNNESDIRNILNFYSNPLKQKLLLEKFQNITPEQIKQEQEKEQKNKENNESFNLINYCRNLKTMKFIMKKGYIFTIEEYEKILDKKIKVLYEFCIHKQKINNNLINMKENNMLSKNQKFNKNLLII